jgi:hypothetical protein
LTNLPGKPYRLRLLRRLGVGALLAPRPVLVPVAGLDAPARRRHVGTLLLSRATICHDVPSQALRRLRTQADLAEEPQDGTKSGRSDGIVRTVYLLRRFARSFPTRTGGPGGHPARHLSRSERHRLYAMKCQREPREDREVGVQLHTVRRGIGRSPSSGASTSGCSRPKKTRATSARAGMPEY